MRLCCIDLGLRGPFEFSKTIIEVASFEEKLISRIALSALGWISCIFTYPLYLLSSLIEGAKPGTRQSLTSDDEELLQVSSFSVKPALPPNMGGEQAVAELSKLYNQFYEVIKTDEHISVFGISDIYLPTGGTCVDQYNRAEAERESFPLREIFLNDLNLCFDQYTAKIRDSSNVNQTYEQASSHLTRLYNGMIYLMRRDDLVKRPYHPGGVGFRNPNNWQCSHIAKVLGLALSSLVDYFLHRPLEVCSPIDIAPGKKPEEVSLKDLQNLQLRLRQTFEAIQTGERNEFFNYYDSMETGGANEIFKDLKRLIHLTWDNGTRLYQEGNGYDNSKGELHSSRLWLPDITLDPLGNAPDAINALSQTEVDEGRVATLIFKPILHNRSNPNLQARGRQLAKTFFNTDWRVIAVGGSGHWRLIHRTVDGQIKLINDNRISDSFLSCSTVLQLRDSVCAGRAKNFYFHFYNNLTNAQSTE